MLMTKGGIDKVNSRPIEREKGIIGIYAKRNKNGNSIII